MIVTALRIVLGVVAGIAIAFALVIAVEFFSAIVHPFPEGFMGTQEEVCAHVARYPHWVLASVVGLWSATIGGAVWVARRIGFRAAAIVVATLLVGGIAANVAMLPYPVWFQVAAPMTGLLAAIAAVRGKARPPAAPTGPGAGNLV